MIKNLCLGSLLASLAVAIFDTHTQPLPVASRNIVIFVADGLRAGSVNSVDSPAMAGIRDRGVSFANSHALFPTFTTSNASAIATGHFLGDTGDYSNAIYIGFPIFASGHFGKIPGSDVPFIENDLVLGDLNVHFSGNYLNQETLLSAARKRGFNTAAIGKVGPAAIQDITELTPASGAFAIPQTIIIDDSTGSPEGVPLSSAAAAALASAGIPLRAPARMQPAGNNAQAGTTSSNEYQQRYFADTTVRAILPMFAKTQKPFVLLFWSRDPDGSQHNQGDSLNKLKPGINGPTSRAGVRDADNDFKHIKDFIDGHPALSGNTDIFLTSDHGFATISKRDIDASGLSTRSYSSQRAYKDADGRLEVNPGFLPPGFLAIDLAHYLKLPLFDPDSQIAVDGHAMYEPVDPELPATPTRRQHPAAGSGLIGGTGKISQDTDAKVIVAANGGSDLIYLPHSLSDSDRNLLKNILDFLTRQDYVGGLFVDDLYGKIPGALPLSSIGLIGSSPLPRPAIVVAFKTFAADPANPATTAVQIADTPLQHGQGMHGGFGRDSTFNFMAAIGPDFKQHFVDPAPAGNADIAPTLARILGFTLNGHGNLTGRILQEAFSSSSARAPYSSHIVASENTAAGKTTVLMYQNSGTQIYLDSACFRPSIHGHGCP